MPYYIWDVLKDTVCVWQKTKDASLSITTNDTTTNNFNEIPLETVQLVSQSVLAGCDRCIAFNNNYFDNF